MHDGLGPVEQYLGAVRVRDANNTVRRHDGAKHVGHMGDRDEADLAGPQARPRSAAMSSSPRSVTGETLSSIPWESRSICHGTMLEWCSIPEISTAWPRFRHLGRSCGPLG